MRNTVPQILENRILTFPDLKVFVDNFIPMLYNNSEGGPKQQPRKGGHALVAVQDSLIFIVEGDIMITNTQFVQRAINGHYLGIPYSKLDCQGFVEKVLSDCGEKHDWCGSNHMWRDALSEKHTINSWADVPAGAWLFVVKQDGGEKDRGYNDKEGNATHVGIYLGDGDIIHSTTGGVQMDTIESNRWTHWGKCKYIYYLDKRPSITDCLRLIGQSSLFDIYEACKTLWG